MAIQRSLEMLAFVFASRTPASKALAQCLIRSASALSSIMSQYLHPLVKADNWAPYADDIRIAVKKFPNFSSNNRNFFKQDWNSQMGSAIMGSGKSFSLAESFHPKEFQWKLRKKNIFSAESDSQVKKDFKALPGICELLQISYSREGWTA